MADIIPFPKRRVADAVALLRRRVDRLPGLAAPLQGFRDRLVDQHAALGTLRDGLMAQASRSYLIGTLALSIEVAIAVGDRVGLAALQEQIEILMRPAAANSDVARQQPDAAD